MKDLAKLCDALLACTNATLDLIQGEDPQLSELSVRVQERATLFSQIFSDKDRPRSNEDTRLLKRLAERLRPIDTKILAWMQANKDSIASTLRQVQQEVQPDPRSPSQARILIQDA